MTANYYVIQPTTHTRKKVSLGDVLSLTESQARPLQNGGFITPDKAAAERIMELEKENAELRVKQVAESENEVKEKETHNGES